MKILFAVTPIQKCSNVACTNKSGEGTFCVVNILQLTIVMCGPCAAILKEAMERIAEK
jgi:hypothetical protein